MRADNTPAMCSFVWLERTKLGSSFMTAAFHKSLIMVCGDFAWNCGISNERRSACCFHSGRASDWHQSCLVFIDSLEAKPLSLRVLRKSTKLLCHPVNDGAASQHLKNIWITGIIGAWQDAMSSEYVQRMILKHEYCSNCYIWIKSQWIQI